MIPISPQSLFSFDTEQAKGEDRMMQQLLFRGRLLPLHFVFLAKYLLLARAFSQRQALENMFSTLSSLISVLPFFMGYISLKC